MKLLNVEVVLNREKDIQGVKSEYDVLRELDDEITSYAILSHRWGAEVGYGEMTGLMKMEEGMRDEVRQRCGYQKIIKSCEQATKDGHKWLQIDTCCIDKRSSSELSEAINSMYRWYQNAQVCYAYLNDVCESIFPTVQDNGKFDQSNGWPEWFMRGWTLQELVAPKQVEFFNKDWVSIGNKRRLAPALEGITRIPRDVLTGGLAAKRLSVAQIMSWAAHRKTTRVEDRAYSLRGLFGVNMPMLHGEGRKAFRRLQLEIIRELSDHSIFAWRPWIPRAGSVLAEDPSDFLDCGDVENVEPDDFADRLIKEYIEPNGLNDESSRSDIDSRARPQHKLAVLRSTVNLQQFRIFVVNNAGIEVLLPVVSFRDSPPHFRAILACRSGFLQTSLVTIDLVCSGSSFSRTSVDFSLAPTYPDFKTLHLIHHQDTNVTRREFQLDDKHASYHGFTRCGTYPRGFRGDAVTLSSLSDDLIVIVYANNDVRSRFAVGLGYYLGQGWVHVCYDESSPTQEEDWTDFVSRAYDRMWKARAKHAQSMPKRQGLSSDEQGAHFVKHAHLPRSIWAARVVWGRWECDNFKVMVDVKQCPGCCDGPSRWTSTSNDRGGLGMPGPMKTVSDSHSLILDGWKAQFDKCSGQRIVLGDYGGYHNDGLIRKGNVFEDMRTLGIDPEDSAYCPVVTHVSGSNWLWSRTKSADDLTMVYSNRGTRLALQQPKGISLPANEHFVLLLKALSTRLAGEHLVITIIQCSDFYEVDRDGERKDLGDDSAPASSNQFQEAGIATPLFAIATPQVWTREWPCEQRRERFKSIRKRFYALVNMDQPPGSAPSRKSASRQKKIRTIDSFSNMFGLHRLRNYIGKITFFARFFQVIEPDPSGDVSPVGATEDGLPGSYQQADSAQSDPRLEVVLPLLHRRYQTLRAVGDVPPQLADDKQKVEYELRSISQTLGADLLHHIMTTFENACYQCLPWPRSRQASHMYYDRQLNTPSMIQEIRALQLKLDATKDEDERRALEEDVTGKILWLFWCGICAEVDGLLPKVIDYVRREGNPVGSSDMWRSATCTDPEDNQAHLRRIMFDAGAGTSKHQLLLAARAAEQAKWSGTTRHTSTIDTQSGTAHSTNIPTPFTPVA